MLALQVPLRLLSELKPAEFPEGESSWEQRKAAIERALANCRIVRDVGTEQMNIISEPDLRDDVHKMRKAALLAIPAAEGALRADTLEDFNQREGEFLPHYDNLIRTVRNFLWDGGQNSKRYLWPLVDEVM